MDVICFGQTNWDFCWTGKQQLMSRLAARGHRVLYVDPRWRVLPRGGRDAWRALAGARSDVALREEAPRLFVHTPTPSPLLPWRVGVAREPAALRRRVRHLGLAAPIVLTLLPRARHLAWQLPAAARVHYAIDEMTGFGGLDDATRARVRSDEEACVRASHRVLAISPRLAQRLARLHPHVHLQPSGADVAHFAAARDRARRVHPAVAGAKGPVLAFVGQVDERLDQALVAAVARARPDWTLVLAGRIKEGVDVAALHALPNLRLPGFLPYEALPDLLRGADVALVPYRDSPLTHACSPLKVYEYLAAGLPVVTTPLDGLGETAEVVRAVRGAAGWIEAVEACLARPEAGLARRLAVAQAASWEHRTDALEGHLEAALRLARRAAAEGAALRPGGWPAAAPAATDAAPRAGGASGGGG